MQIIKDLKKTLQFLSGKVGTQTQYNIFKILVTVLSQDPNMHAIKQLPKPEKKEDKDQRMEYNTALG